MLVFIIILLAVAAFGWFVAGKNSDGTRSWPMTLIWCFAPLVIAVLLFMYLKKKKRQLSQKVAGIGTSKKRAGFKGVNIRKKYM